MTFIPGQARASAVLRSGCYALTECLSLTPPPKSPRFSDGDAGSSSEMGHGRRTSTKISPSRLHLSDRRGSCSRTSPLIDAVASQWLTGTTSRTGESAGAGSREILSSRPPSPPGLPRHAVHCSTGPTGRSRTRPLLRDRRSLHLRDAGGSSSVPLLKGAYDEDWRKGSPASRAADGAPRMRIQAIPRSSRRHPLDLADTGAA